MALMSLADIAKEISIPESNARYYQKKFAAYFPTVGNGRTRRYESKAVEVMRMIAEGFKNNLPAEVVEEQLQAEFGIPTQPQAITQQQNSVSPKVLEIIGQQSKQLAVAMEQIQELRTEQRQIKEQLDGHYRLVDERLRKVMEEKQESKGFWQRLFS